MAKRISIILVLSILSMFLFAGSAFAVYGDAGFIDWDSGDQPVGYTDTPHRGFLSNTYKCAVCHAVHNADRNGVGEILLEATVANACVACHIEGGITTAQVYGSDVGNYDTDTRFNHSNDTANILAQRVACADCHAVHGADTVTAGSTFDTYILRADYGGSVIPSGSLTAGTVDDAILSTYCAQCHEYYGTAYDDGVTAVEHHVMVADSGQYDNAVSQFASTPGDVAGADAEYCFDCHDNYDLADGFPHDMDAERFMNIAPYVGGTETTAGAGEASADGACVKCHMYGTAGDAGVGIDF